MRSKSDLEGQQNLGPAREGEIYFDAHRDELSAKYPEQWVAIYRNRVIASAAQLDDLMSQLERNDLPLGHIFVEYASENGGTLIVACS